MNKLSKNRKNLIAKIQQDKNYPINEALDLLKEMSFTKFVCTSIIVCILISLILLHIISKSLCVLGSPPWK